jgi:hypothetical protein
VAISDAMQHLQGWIIVFVRDHMLLGNPMPILLLTQKMWQWAKESVSTRGQTLLKYYYDDDNAKLGSHGGMDFAKVMAISKGMEQKR